ncbi:MAG: hypothetical protein AAFV78_02870 [Bacteroidota bacterium]
MPGSLTISKCTCKEIEPGTEWVIIDQGFAQASNKSCGFLHYEESGDSFEVEGKAISFSQMVEELKGLIYGSESNPDPLYLMIEAPLSISMKAGSPTGRWFEKKDKQTRYWYTGAGASTCLAVIALFQSIVREKNSRKPRPIKIYEGFVSFKDSEGSVGQKGHIRDVKLLGKALMNKNKKVCNDSLFWKETPFWSDPSDCKDVCTHSIFDFFMPKLCTSSVEPPLVLFPSHST